ncbi:MAG: hypothetical protein ABI876_15155 [Bacteroidota bacterium]
MCDRGKDCRRLTSLEITLSSFNATTFSAGHPAARCMRSSSQIHGRTPMRRFLLPFSFAILFAFIVSYSLRAQSAADSIRAVMIADSAGTSFGGYIGTTLVPVAFGALNSYLESTRFKGHLFSTYISQISFHPTFGASLARGRLIAGIEAVVPASSDNAPSPDWRNPSANIAITHYFWLIDSYLGYSIINTRHVRLWPYVGVEGRFNYLTFSDEYGYYMTQLLLDTAGTNKSFSNKVFSLCAGIGAECSLPLWQTERGTDNLVIGIRAGFSRGVISTPWYFSERENSLGDGPDIRQSGLTLAMTIGINSVPVIYRGKILDNGGSRTFAELSPMVPPTTRASSGKWSYGATIAAC